MMHRTCTWPCIWKSSPRAQPSMCTMGSCRWWSRCSPFLQGTCPKEVQHQTVLGRVPVVWPRSRVGSG
jgi:hypothetical protein